MDTNLAKEQAAYRAHIAFGEKEPAWMQQALSAINAWGRAEATLAHAVGVALMDAYQRGIDANPPVFVPPTVKRVMRTQAPPEEGATPSKILIRRR